MIQSKIDTRFLSSLEQSNFQDNICRMSEWFQTALGAFKYKEELPYYPTIFVTPFYVSIRARVDLHRTMVMRCVGITTVDVDDPLNRWAVYVLRHFVERASATINIANLAHELAHFHARAKGLDAISPEELHDAVKKGKSPLEIYKIKEREVKNVEQLFEEPVHSMILAMEREKSEDPGASKRYCADAIEIAQEELLDRILGPDAAEVVVERQFRRIKEYLVAKGYSDMTP